jgi:hypothetical protein
MSLFVRIPTSGLIEPPRAKGTMTRTELRKLRPADLRLIAARTREAERERKMLALAEQLEEREREQHKRDQSGHYASGQA